MKTKLFIIVLCQITIFTFSQNVVLDNSFGNSGTVVTPNTSEIIDLAATTNGKIVTAGYSNQVSNLGIYHLSVAKNNQDGSPDLSFGTNGIVQTVIDYSEYVNDLLIQTDNKILIAGSYNLQPPPIGPGGRGSFLIRYLENGSLDASFGANGIVKIPNLTGDQITSIVLLPNNQILAGGNLNSLGCITKFNNDGSIDTSFANSGIKTFNDPDFKFTFWDFILLNDGSVLSCGYDYTISNQTNGAAVKVDLQGNLDNTFGNNGKVILTIPSNPFPGFVYVGFTAIKETSDNKIILNGDFNINKLVKLLPNGQFDSSFGTNGIVNHNVPNRAIAIQENGKILVGGNKNISGFNNGYTISRFDASGNLETDFNATGFFDVDLSAGNDYLQCMQLQNDGKLLIGGSTRPDQDASFALTRITITDNLSVENNIFVNNQNKIYPNPFDNELNYNTKDKINKISVFDLQGKIISEMSNLTTNEKIKVNLNKGSYLLKTEFENGLKSIEKIIKN